jgi:hypothetical protein
MLWLLTVDATESSATPNADAQQPRCWAVTVQQTASPQALARSCESGLARSVVRLAD